MTNTPPIDDVKLEACPFCGGEAHPRRGAVWCSGCDVEMHEGRDGIPSAVAAWNTRTPPHADTLSLPREAEALAQRFHETYERLAPSFGYETREASAKPWADVPDNNKRLMIAVCGEILARLAHSLPVEAGVLERVREVLEPFAAMRLSHEPEVSDCLYRSPKAELHRRAKMLDDRDAEIKAARALLADLGDGG